HQQDVPDDRPRDGSLDDVVKTSAQRGERDYELSGVAERGIEKSSHSFSHSFRELFGGAAHPPCQGENGKGGGQEDEEISLGSEEFETDRDGHEDEKPVYRDLTHSELVRYAQPCWVLPHVASNGR